MRITKYLLLLPIFTVALLFAACAGSGTSESTGQYVDNTVITTKVKSVLFDKLGFASVGIKVKSYKNTVQLSGFVDDEATIAQAGEITRSISGVESVRNDLQLKQ